MIACRKSSKPWKWLISSSLVTSWRVRIHQNGRLDSIDLAAHFVVQHHAMTVRGHIWISSTLTGPWQVLIMSPNYFGFTRKKPLLFWWVLDITFPARRSWLAPNCEGNCYLCRAGTSLSICSIRGSHQNISEYFFMRVIYVQNFLTIFRIWPPANHK